MVQACVQSHQEDNDYSGWTLLLLHEYYCWGKRNDGNTSAIAVEGSRGPYILKFFPNMSLYSISEVKYVEEEASYKNINVKDMFC